MSRLTLAEFDLDGRAALKHILERSDYGGIGQALASLTLFAAPQTVRQTGGQAIFPAVRSVGRKDRRQRVEVDGRRLWKDDNELPNAIFACCRGTTKIPRDVQLNHIYARRNDPDCFTALPNLCLTPSFLAKLTDHDPYSQQILRRRAYELYEWRPIGEPVPAEPTDYRGLVWAPTLPPVEDFERTMREVVMSKRGACLSVARDIGWLFSGGAPDPMFAGH